MPTLRHLSKFARFKGANIRSCETIDLSAVCESPLSKAVHENDPYMLESSVRNGDRHICELLSITEHSTRQPFTAKREEEGTTGSCTVCRARPGRI